VPRSTHAARAMVRLSAGRRLAGLLALLLACACSLAGCADLRPLHAAGSGAPGGTAAARLQTEEPQPNGEAPLQKAEEPPPAGQDPMPQAGESGIEAGVSATEAGGSVTPAREPVRDAEGNVAGVVPERRLDPALAGTYDFIEISDLHNTLESETGEPVLSVLAANLRRIDAENPGKTLMLSGGDNVDGSLRQLRDESDAPVMEALEAMGVDATALGNHEYREYGVERLVDETLADCDIPVLCANLLDPKTRDPAFEPSRVFRLGGLRVAVVGSSCDKIRKRYISKDNPEWIYVPHAEAINAQTSAIRSANQADLVVALVHEGGYEDGKGKGGGTLVKLAQELEGVDAVFGGDTHTVVRVAADGVPVVVPGSEGTGYMRVTLTVGPDGGMRFDMRFVRLNTEETNGYRAAQPVCDPEVEAIIREALAD